MGAREVQEGRDICICIADLLCWTAETNTKISIVESNYTPIKLKKKKKLKIEISSQEMLVQAFYRSRLCKNPLIEIWYLFYWSLDKKLESTRCSPSELVDNEGLKKTKGILLHIHIGWWAKANSCWWNSGIWAALRN